MRRDAAGKFIRKWELESKKRVSVTLTNTAWQRLKEEAQKWGISRSEVIERIARSFDSSGAIDLTQAQELIWEQQQTIATLQRQKQELETLLQQGRQRSPQNAAPVDQE